MDALTAITSRPITFTHNGSVTRRPAGVEVYVTERRNGWVQIRIPGSLWMQDVRMDSLIVP